MQLLHNGAGFTPSPFQAPFSLRGSRPPPSGVRRRPVQAPRSRHTVPGALRLHAMAVGALARWVAAFPPTTDRYRATHRGGQGSSRERRIGATSAAIWRDKAGGVRCIAIGPNESDRRRQHSTRSRIAKGIDISTLFDH